MSVVVLTHGLIKNPAAISGVWDAASCARAPGQQRHACRCPGRHSTLLFFIATGGKELVSSGVSRNKKKRSDKPGLSLRERWRAWYASRGPVFRFGLNFGLWLGLFYAILTTPFFDRALYGYLEANAWLANVVLLGMGQHTQVSEVIIQSQAPPFFSMAIRRGCDAVEPTWLLCAAMISFPAPLLHKLRGMLAAIVLLQVLNLARIITLYWIGIHFPAFFYSAHMEIWPTAFIVAAIAIFVVWKEKSQQLEPRVAD